MNPFRAIFQLSLGDLLAKIVSFFAAIFLARILGAGSFGVYEFAVTILAYLTLTADAGLEIWATREATHGGDPGPLMARVLALRVLLASTVLVCVPLLLTLLPTDFPYLTMTLGILSLTLMVQALNLKWLFLGSEKMASVGRGLLLQQLVFAGACLLAVRKPEDVPIVAAIRLLGEIALCVYFWVLFKRSHGRPHLRFSFNKLTQTLRSALPIGLANALGILSFNFDVLLLGIVSGSVAVGIYSAAYKIVLIALAVPLTYFSGLMPTLSRAFREDPQRYGDIARQSLRLLGILAVPVGVGGLFLAEPLILTLFGEAYRASVPVCQILIWSASLIILRGTFRQGLLAAEKQRVDLACAATATFINVALNLILIPRYGVIGAAAATLIAECCYLCIGWYAFSRLILRVNLARLVLPAAIAGIPLTLSFVLTQSLWWVFQGVLALLVYAIALLALGQRRTLERAISRNW